MHHRVNARLRRQPHTWALLLHPLSTADRVIRCQSVLPSCSTTNRTHGNRLSSASTISRTSNRLAAWFPRLILTLVAAKCLVCCWWKAPKVNWVTFRLPAEKSPTKPTASPLVPPPVAWHVEQRQLFPSRYSRHDGRMRNLKRYKQTLNNLWTVWTISTTKAQAEQEIEAQRLLIIEGAEKHVKNNANKVKKALMSKPSNS